MDLLQTLVVDVIVGPSTKKLRGGRKLSRYISTMNLERIISQSERKTIRVYRLTSTT